MRNRKNLIYYCLVIWFGSAFNGYSQTQLIIAGGHLVQSDTTRLVLQDTELINQGTYTSSQGTVVLTGTGSDEVSALGGDSLSTFYNLEINKTTNGAQLQQNIEVANELRMSSGTLDLNGDTLTLGSASGVIVEESEDHRIIGPNGGLVQKTTALNAPSSENPGNLGLSISSSEDLGNTLIQRIHLPQSLNDTTSIARSFNISPTNNSKLNATLLLHYFDAELNNYFASNLSPWRQDSTFWYNPSATLIDSFNNYVQVDSIGFFGGAWTLAPSAPRFDLSVFLAGNYEVDSTKMTDDLRVATVIPTGEPYASLGYTHPASGGTESLNPAVFDCDNSDAIVDWVFVELRDSVDVSIVIAARSALLQRDGDVVDLDGYSLLSFPEVAKTEKPLVTIRHRNHIGIIAASTVDLSQDTVVIDFAGTPSLAQGGAAAMKDFGDGYYGLISGDFDGDGQIQNIDSNAQNQRLGSSGYLPGDSDLNGQVQNIDLQIKLTPNLGRGSQFSY